MKKQTRMFGATVLALACLVNGSAAPAAPQAMTQSVRAAPLPEVPATALRLSVAGNLADGRSFAGTLSITKIGLNEVNQILVSGILNGVIGSNEAFVIGQVVNAIPTAAATPSGCDVLNLDLGPLNLDLLGVTVDLSPVTLDVVAQPGAGNLVGNLLCAVVSLLNNPLDTILQVVDIIEKINEILSGK